MSKRKQPGTPPSQRQPRTRPTNLAIKVAVLPELPTDQRSKIPQMNKLWDDHPAERAAFVHQLPDCFRTFMLASGLSDDEICIALYYPFARYMGHATVRLGKDIYDLSHESCEPGNAVARFLLGAQMVIVDRAKTDPRFKFDLENEAAPLEERAQKLAEIAILYAKENGWTGEERSES